MSNKIEWRDDIKDGEHHLSALWLVPEKMVVVVSNKGVFSRSGSFTVMCPQLEIQHEHLEATNYDEAKNEAIKVVHKRLKMYGDGLRSYLDQLLNNSKTNSNE